MALVLTVVAFLATHQNTTIGSSADQFKTVGRQWYGWSQGWVSDSSEVGAMAIGLLTAALALFVATSVTSLERERTSVDGIASRLLLDDLNRLVCLFGSVAAWLLSVGAGWTRASGLSWGSAALTGVVLAVLAACAEIRPLAADYQRWMLMRADAALRKHAGLPSSDSEEANDIPTPERWVHAFPWRWAFLLAVVAALPAIVQMALRYPHDPLGVSLLSALIVVVWVVLLGAAWSWCSDLRATRVRSSRAVPLDSLALGCFLFVVFALIGTAALAVGDPWGLVSVALILVAGAITLLVKLDADLRQRDMLRTLASVRAALELMPALEPEIEQVAAQRRTRWTFELGSLRIARYHDRSPRS